jgi:hypothetical protein
LKSFILNSSFLHLYQKQNEGNKSKENETDKTRENETAITFLVLTVVGLIFNDSSSRYAYKISVEEYYILSYLAKKYQ